MAYIQLRVPQEIADAVARRELSQTELVGLVRQHYSQTLPQNRVIDPQSADNGAIRTQEQWSSYFNEAGKPMISAPNIYQAGKTATDKVLASLRRDFNESWLVSSTRISYGDDLSGKIMHNHGSRVVKPSQIDVKVIPVYDDTPLAKALQSDDGIAYLHSLFDTADEPQDITRTLENLSKRGADRIALWTPDQDSRNSYSERAVRFGVGHRFGVFGYDRFDDYCGRSRGVSIKSAKPTRKK